MEQHLLMFGIFLTCSLFVMSIKFPVIGSKDFTRRKSVTRHKTFDHVVSRKRLLRTSKKDVRGSASRKQYARELFAQVSRSTDQQMSVQERKGKVSNNKRSVDVISGAKRFKRSVHQPQKDLPSFLLYIADNEIKKLTLDEVPNETTLVSREDLNGSPPSFIDFHYKENRLYWADKNSIHRSFLNDGSGIQTIHRNLPSVKGIAVDWLGNNIYWIGQQNIMVSRTDGRFLKTLVSANPIDSQLVLDPEKGYMYWLSPIHYEDDSENSRIMRADMCTGNKNGVDDDILRDISAHTQFAIDYYSERKLYWTTENPLLIKCLKLDSDVDKIKDCEPTLGLSKPTSLSVSETYIYGFEGSSIQRINKTGDRDGTSLKLIKDNINVTQSTSLKVVHWGIQKEFVGYDACSTWRHCSHLCLPDPGFHLFRCSCPDNMTTVGHLYWNRTCGCPSGQFVDLNGDCTYLDAPWNVIATPLNNTAIKLTWLPPKVRRQSDQMMYYYIFYGVYPNGIRRWPQGRSNATEFVIGGLKSTIRYVIKVSLGVPGRRSLPVDIKPTFGVKPPPTQPQTASSMSTLTKASTATTGTSATKPPRSSGETSSTITSPMQSTNPTTSKSKPTHTSSTKPPRSSGEKSSTITSAMQSTNPRTSQSKATYYSSTKSPLSSKVISSTTRRTSGGSSLSMSSSVVTHASPANPLPLKKNKSFPYWSIGVAGGSVILVLIVVFLVCRYKRRTQDDITMVPLPIAPAFTVAEMENSKEDDQEDEMLLRETEA